MLFKMASNKSRWALPFSDGALLDGHLENSAHNTTRDKLLSERNARITLTFQKFSILIGTPKLSEKHSETIRLSYLFCRAARILLFSVATRSICRNYIRSMKHEREREKKIGLAKFHSNFLVNVGGREKGGGREREKLSSSYHFNFKFSNK